MPSADDWRGTGQEGMAPTDPQKKERGANLENMLKKDGESSEIKKE